MDVRVVAISDSEGTAPLPALRASTPNGKLSGLDARIGVPREEGRSPALFALLRWRGRAGVYMLSPASSTMPSDAIVDVGVPATLSELDRPVESQQRRWLRYRRHHGLQASTWGRTVASLVQLLSRRRGIQLQRTPQVLAHVQPLRPSARAAEAMHSEDLGVADLPQLAAAAGGPGVPVATGDVDEESLAST